MPLYELGCKKCNVKYEVTMSLKEKDAYDKGKTYKKCPHCLSKLIPLMSKPMFKIKV